MFNVRIANNKDWATRLDRFEEKSTSFIVAHAQLAIATTAPTKLHTKLD